MCYHVMNMNCWTNETNGYTEHIWCDNSDVMVPASLGDSLLGLANC